jgi:predicted nuclease of predicted toxin-antitoxin system
MKLLLDSCVWGGALPELQAAGHDAIWAGSWERDPGDMEILKRAFDEQRVLVTLDKDFGELAILHGQPHVGIIRLVNFQARQQAPACQNTIENYADDLAAAAIITVQPDQVRIRRTD